jgi:hypothetical protein
LVREARHHSGRSRFSTPNHQDHTIQRVTCGLEEIRDDPPAVISFDDKDYRVWIDLPYRGALRRDGHDRERNIF